jgi:hypothetical protein
VLSRISSLHARQSGCHAGQGKTTLSFNPITRACRTILRVQDPRKPPGQSYITVSSADHSSIGSDVASQSNTAAQSASWPGELNLDHDFNS